MAFRQPTARERGRVINNVADLPREFDLDAYALTARFRLQDWIPNLRYRAAHFWSITTVTREEKIKNASALLRSPLLSVDSCAAYLTTPWVGRPVGFQTLGEISWFADQDRFRKYAADWRQKPGKAYEPVWESVSKAGLWHSPLKAYATVNLHAPDELLLSSFKAWIAEAREAMGVTRPRVRATEFEQISRNQVLAYADLLIWAKCNDAQITQNVLGQALFPEESDVALPERIRKVVHPDYVRCVNRDYCLYLESVWRKTDESEPIKPLVEWRDILLASFLQDGEKKLITPLPCDLEPEHFF